MTTPSARTHLASMMTLVLFAALLVGAACSTATMQRLDDRPWPTGQDRPGGAKP